MVNLFIIPSPHATGANSRATGIIASRSVFLGFICALELIVLVGNTGGSALAFAVWCGVPVFPSHIICLPKGALLLLAQFAIPFHRSDAQQSSF